MSWRITCVGKWCHLIAFLSLASHLDLDSTQFCYRFVNKAVEFLKPFLETWVFLRHLLDPPSPSIVPADATRQRVPRPLLPLAQDLGESRGKVAQFEEGFDEYA